MPEQKLCKWDARPVPPSKHKDREFCCDRCRARWHADQRRRALQSTADVIDGAIATLVAERDKILALIPRARGPRDKASAAARPDLYGYVITGDADSD